MKRYTLALSILAVLVACRDTKDATPLDSGVEPETVDTADTQDSAPPEDTEPVDEDGDGIPASQDCDDTDPDEEASTPDTWYADSDGDGYGDPENPVEACEQPSDAVDNTLDCDDNDASTNPDGEDVCDGVDNDCDGMIDEPPVEDLNDLTPQEPVYTLSEVLELHGFEQEVTVADVDAMCADYPSSVAILEDAIGVVTTYTDTGTALELAAADLSSTAGDVTIWLCPGTFEGTQDFASWIGNLTIAGSGRDNTIITSTRERGLRFYDFATVYVANLSISENDSSNSEPRGAGVKHTVATAIYSDVSVTSNTARFEGGHGAGLNLSGSTVFLFGAEIWDNGTTYSGAKGAATYSRPKLDEPGPANSWTYAQASAIYGNWDGGSATYLRYEGDSSDTDDEVSYFEFDNVYYCNQEIAADLRVEDVDGAQQDVVAIDVDTADGAQDAVITGWCDASLRYESGSDVLYFGCQITPAH